MGMVQGQKKRCIILLLLSTVKIILRIGLLLLAATTKTASASFCFPLCFFDTIPPLSNKVCIGFLCPTISTKRFLPPPLTRHCRPQFRYWAHSLIPPLPHCSVRHPSSGLGNKNPNNKNHNLNQDFFFKKICSFDLNQKNRDFLI